MKITMIIEFMALNSWIYIIILYIYKLYIFLPKIYINIDKIGHKKNPKITPKI